MLFFILLIVFVAVLRLPAVKGFLGEAGVRRALKKLPEQDYLVLNDVMLPNQGKTTQVDHIVLSKYGIFVIETKNYKGWIIGKEKDRQWTQVIYKRKERFYNPIHQNYGHIKALETILSGVYEGDFHSIICFSDRATLKNIEVQSSDVKVIYSSQLLKTIFSYQQATNSSFEIQQLAEMIKSAAISNDRKAKKDHVRTIKTKQQEIKAKIQARQCPKCGGQLVKRKGKYGEFLGCSNYPKCRFIEKRAN
ncbi:NERD domain-containing protein [Pullulanibacillus sp. KACC 23026]|uniref:NERD domain-containing protein n=1 Tax=Pullulanibacillus sp. KACC 23026 TaxID=3028315 RepID=UPI0023B092E9|nr:NERD domain-containing protein [Pullulanibacillus sp. KACC 23026]WEG11161.1 NERD domain-containing protein [Pullulanibacillus sp. KACC 23026]